MMTLTIAELIGVLGLIATIIGATWKLGASVTEATQAMRALTRRLDKLDTDNEQEHAALHGKLEVHDNTLADHETRITILEHEK